MLFRSVGSRTKLISVKGQDGMFALAPVPNDGICTSMVETKGYVCEDHKVIWLHTLLFALPSVEIYSRHLFTV